MEACSQDRRCIEGRCDQMVGFLRASYPPRQREFRSAAIALKLTILETYLPSRGFRCKIYENIRKVCLSFTDYISELSITSYLMGMEF